MFTRFAVMHTILLLLSFTLLSALAGAATISVPGDSPSLKGAMIKARAGDIILVSCGTYYEFDILMKPGVSLWSSTLQPDCVTIDARGQGRCLIFSDADSTTTVVGFTFKGGRAITPERDRGGAILCQNSSARLTRCRFVGNQALDGGALATVGDQGPLLDECHFMNNEAQAGGALAWRAKSGSLRRCTFLSNVASLAGGAITAKAGQMELINCLFKNNEAGNSGGALFLKSSQCRVIATVFLGNQGGLDGGAIACQGGALNLQHCTFHANDSDGQATVLSSRQANPVLTDCLVTGSANPMMTGSAGDYLITRTNIVPLDDQGWPSVVASEANSAGNRSVDPEYCAPELGDLHLRRGSPCLGASPENRMGALAQGCGAQFP